MAATFDIVTITEGDSEKIKDFLNEHFFKGEPLNIATGRPHTSDKNDTTFPNKMIAEGLSIMAISKHDHSLLGVCLNKCKYKGSPPEYSDHKIGRFLNHVENSVNIWDVYGTERAFSINFLAVNVASRGSGVGKALMENSRKIALTAGYPLLYVLCTSYFSGKLARNLGMECIYSLPYSDYKDEEGKPVFVPPAPHTEAAVFVQTL